MPAAGVGGIRFVVDENLVALGLALRHLRRGEFAVFGQGELADELPIGILDSDWIPVVGGQRWVVITNDKRLRTRPHESALALEHGLRVVHLHGAVGMQRPWDQATRLLNRWPSIERALTATPHGALWVSVRAGGVRVLPFADPPGR